jgi:L-aminopeptidase/D-esterase-like protein
VGAGRGARAGLAPGGLGSASLDLGDGLVVGAVVGVNPVGSVLMPDGRTYWAWPFEIDGEFGGGRPAPDVAAVDPAPADTRLAEHAGAAPGSSTVIAVVATSAELTTAECRRLATMAHDGIARAVRPAHTPLDGDTVFALATGLARLQADVPRAVQLARIGSAAADCLTRAIARGVYAARS